MMTLEQLERWRAAFNEGYGWGDMGGVEARKQTNALCDLAKIALSPPQDVAGLCEELRGLAEKATPGPWTYETDDEGSSMGWIDYQPHDVASRSLFDVCGDSAQQAMNAEYVAAANPANMTKLLDCITSLSARNTRLETEVSRLTNLAQEGRKRGIYIASKTLHAAWWKNWRSEGAPIISSWIDEAGAGETADFSDLWLRCIKEATSAELLICYRETGEHLKGAFIEIGAALATGVPVICIGDFDGMSFVNHPNVKQIGSLAEARALARALIPQEQGEKGK